MYDAPDGSAASIARRLGTTPATVRSWLRKHGIPLRTHAEAASRANAHLFTKTKPSATQLQRAFDAGMTTPEMAEEFGLASCSVLCLAREHGVERPGHGARVSNSKRKSFTARVASMPDPSETYRECGFNFGATAKKLGVPRTTLEALLDHYQVPIVVPWRSRAEIELYDFIREADPEGGWVACDRSVLGDRELDAVSHSRKLAIDYGAMYYHGEVGRGGRSGRGPGYHRDKTVRCAERGYELVTVFDYDDPDKVRRLLRAKLGLLPRVGARECAVSRVDGEGRGFEDAYHLAGSTGAACRYALSYRGSVMSVMSFRRHARHEWEVARYTVGETVVVGGAARLFKRFVEEHDSDQVLTFSDLRFGDGSVYERLGFVRLPDTAPNYKYFRAPDAYRPHSRQMFQKHKLADRLEKFDPALSEWENMRANGWNRIWDCGNAKYVWRRD